MSALRLGLPHPSEIELTDYRTNAYSSSSRIWVCKPSICSPKSIHGPRGFITSSMSPSNNRYGITWIPASITPLACLLSPENLYSVIIWTEPLPIALWVTNDARPIYDHNFQFWDRKVARIEAIVDKWNDMHDHIYSTMAIQHHSILLEKDTPHKKLKALREWFTQDPYTHIWDLYQKWYHYLIKTPHSQNIQKLWMAGLASFGMLANTDEPCLKGKNEDHDAIFCFIDTWSHLGHQHEPGLADQGKGQHPWGLKLYRGHLQEISATSSGPEAAYTTLGNLSTNQQPNSRKEANKPQQQHEKEKRPCVCGQDHLYKNCPYIVDSKWPLNWQPDAGIQAHVVEKSKNPLQLAIFNRVWKAAQLPPWQKPTTTQATSSTSTALVPASSAVQNVNHVDNTAIQGVFAVTNVFSVSANIPKEANPAIHNFWMFCKQGVLMR